MNTRGFVELMEDQSKVNKQLSEVHNRTLQNSVCCYISFHLGKAAAKERFKMFSLTNTLEANVSLVV